MTLLLPAPGHVLPEAAWRERQRAHAARVDGWTAGQRARAARGEEPENDPMKACGDFDVSPAYCGSPFALSHFRFYSTSSATCTPGPCTPSIRMPSTSAVFEGPVTHTMFGSSPIASTAAGRSA